MPHTNSITISVHGTPRPGGSKTPRGKYNPATGKVKMWTTDANPKAADWKACVAHEAAMVMRGREPMLGPLAATVTFYVTRPGGHTGKKGLKPSAPKYPTTKPDATKLWRSTEDALTGIVWKDDAQIVTQAISKRFADGRGSGAEIVISESAA